MDMSETIRSEINEKGIRGALSPLSQFQYAKMFLRVYRVSDIMFRALKEHYEVNGIDPRVHRNEKKLPSNTLSKSQLEDITAFISNYAEINAIELSGRIPGNKKDDIPVL